MIVDKATALPGVAQAESWELRPYPGGRFAVVAASLCGGAAWMWLVETIEGIFADLGQSCPPRDELFAQVDRLARGSGTKGLHVVPHFLGTRHGPADRGAIQGIDLHNMRLGPLARALALGILCELRESLPAKALEGKTRIVCSGNALRRNEGLRTAAREVFGLPVVLAEDEEEAATGAALLAST